MAYSVELYDKTTSTTYDITNRVVEMNIKLRLDNENNEYEIKAVGISNDHQFNTITIKKDGTTEYQGIVADQQEDFNLPLKITTFKCFDYSFILNNRVVAEFYISKTPDYIINDIVTKYVPELTTTNVQTSSITLDQTVLNYISALDSFKQVTEQLYDWHWYVDGNNDIHLFYQYETVGSDITQYIVLLQSFQIKVEGSQSANRVWIVGTKESDPNYIEQYFQTDGTQRYFLLPYEPNYTEIYLDTGGGYVLQDSALEQNDDGNQDFLINKKARVVYSPGYTSAPSSGTLKVKYRPTKQLIDYYENPSEIATYGVIEKVIRNKDITDRLSARRYGKAELRRKSIKKRILEFETRTPFSLGQKCTANISLDLMNPDTSTDYTYNISGNFLVAEVDIQINPVDVLYKVTCEEVV